MSELFALQQLRETAGLSQQDAARFFEMKDRRSIGAWELGKSRPHHTRRTRFMIYLLDKLGLRRQPEEFLQLWQEIAFAKWGWRMLNDQELRHCFPGSIRHLAVTQNQVVVTFWGGEQRCAPFLAPPTPPYELVGRRELLEDLKQRMRNGRNLVLTALNGLPGVGKTALAIELAHDSDILEHFHDGILWARLGPEPNLAALLANWGAALELPSQEWNSLQSWTEAIRAHIGLRRILLIADDAWQPETALALKVGGPNCVHLITTRFPHVAACFAGGGTVAVHELAVQAGLTLLTRLAPEVVADEPDDARELVRAVGSLPLALILIGNYLRILALSGRRHLLRPALQQLLSGKVGRLHLAQPQSPLERQPSLRAGATVSLEAVIGASANALPDAARQALSALSVYPAKPNSFSRAAAIATAAVPAGEIDRLADYGLLETVGSDRYTLHQTIADYASLRPKQDAVHQRLVSYFIDYVTAHQQDFLALELEISNVLAALEIAYQCQMAAELVHLSRLFYDFLYTRNLYDLAELHLRRAEQAARRAHDLAGVATMLQALGRLATRRGRYPEAEGCHLKALQLARRLGLDEIEVGSLRNLGVVSWYQSHFGQAMIYYEQALRLYRKSGDQKGEGAILSNMGMIFEGQGEHARARQEYEKSLALMRQTGDLPGEGITLNLLGGLALTEGDYGAARCFTEQYLSICQQLGDQQETGVALTNLGILSSDQGDYVAAGAYYVEALEICRRLGDRQGEGFTVGCLAMLHYRLGEHEIAQDYGRQAIDIGREIGDRANEAYALTVLGHALLALRRHKKADSAYQDALAIRQELKQPHLALHCLAGLAEVRLARSKESEALAHVEKALDYLHHTPERAARTSFYVYLVCYRVLRANQDPRAGKVLETAYHLLQKCASSLRTQESRRLFWENVSIHREIVREFEHHFLEAKAP
jgi:tetratricopeptide (TPR) repeat protein